MALAWEPKEATMASLEKRWDKYRIVYCVDGKRNYVSLKTGDPKQADGLKKQLEAGLALFQAGILKPPDGADLGVFLLSRGETVERPTAVKPQTVRQFLEAYQQGQRTKEGSTLYTEDIHIEHLLRHIGDLSIRAVQTKELQQYIEDRKAEAVAGSTVKKEIGSLAAIWNKWGVPQGLVLNAAPTKGLDYGKRKAKPPFQTWAAIEQQIKRGKLSPEKQDELWDALFLSLDQIEEMLAFVQKHARHAFLYPLFVFVAHTGARRSEILRSEIDDFQFDVGQVRLREKKRDKSREFTFRHVPLTPLLEEAMKAWFKVHPGGSLTICQEADLPLTPQLASHHFRWTVDGSKWEVLRGYHVLRHSFASCCAMKGVDHRLIDAWLGHQTAEMAARYRHLFPSQQRTALHSVFGG